MCFFPPMCSVAWNPYVVRFEYILQCVVLNAKPDLWSADCHVQTVVFSVGEKEHQSETHSRVLQTSRSKRGSPFDWLIERPKHRKPLSPGCRCFQGKGWCFMVCCRNVYFTEFSRCYHNTDKIFNTNGKDRGRSWTWITWFTVPEILS